MLCSAYASSTLLDSSFALFRIEVMGATLANENSHGWNFRCEGKRKVQNCSFIIYLTTAAILFVFLLEFIFVPGDAPDAEDVGRAASYLEFLWRILRCPRVMQEFTSTCDTAFKSPKPQKRRYQITGRFY